MKNVVSIIVLALVTLISCKEKSEIQKDIYKKYPFKSAVVTYKVEGNVTGTKMLYIDDYGHKEAEKSEIITSIMGFQTKEKEDVVTVGADVFVINHEEKTVARQVNPFYKDYAENVGKDYMKIGKDALVSLGYKQEGTASLLEKTCDVWKGMNTIIYVWKGLVLKSETNMTGMNIIETAIDINQNSEIPQDVFKVPEGYSLQKVPNVVGLGEIMEEVDNEITNEDKKKMQEVQKMSFEDWKKEVVKNDVEMADKTDAELKQIYDMMQFAINKLGD